MKKRTLFGAAGWAASLAAAFLAGALSYKGAPAEEVRPEAPRLEARTARPGSSPAPAGLQSPEPALALAAAQRLVTNGSTEDLARAVGELASTWQSGDSSPLLQLCLEAWGHRDGSAALDLFTSESHDTEFRSWALQHLVAGWTKADPHGALAWLSEKSKSSADEGAAALPTALRLAAANGESAAALETAGKISAGPARDRAAQAIVAGVTRGASIPETTKWFSSTGSRSPLANDLLRPLVGALLATSPSDAADWAAGLADPSQRVPAFAELGGLWARQSPEDAAAWAAQQAESEARSAYLAEVVKAWAPIDPQAVGEWLNSIPPAADVDRALVSFVNQIAQTDPAIAAQWAETIGNDYARQRAVLQVSNIWRDTDPDAAMLWRATTLSRTAPSP